MRKLITIMAAILVFGAIVGTTSAGDFIYNTDGCDMLYWPDGLPETPENFTKQRLKYALGTGVRTVSYCPLSSGFGRFTCRFAGEPATNNISGVPRTHNAARAFFAQGTDSLQMAIDFCRSNKLEIIVSVRVNDQHDEDCSRGYSGFYPQFKYDHPDCIMGESNQTKNAHFIVPWGIWSCVDFTHKLVRDRMRTFVRELVENYDVDGIEYDFNRHLMLFKSVAMGGVASDEERAMMTELMRDLRTMTENVARKRGRPFRVQMRMPDTADYCRDCGIDLAHWLKEKLMDVWVGGGYFQLAPWDEAVALAHRYGVKFFASMDESRIEGMCKIRKLPYIPGRGTVEAYAARFAQVRMMGCDGIYLFNCEWDFMNRVARLDAERVRQSDQIYFATYLGSSHYTVNSTLKNGVRHMKLPRIDPGVTEGEIVTYGPGEQLSFPMWIGDVGAGAAAPVRRIVAKALTNLLKNDSFELCVNGRKFKPVSFKDGLFAYELPIDAIRSGRNELSVTFPNRCGSHRLLDFAIEFKAPSCAAPGSLATVNVRDCGARESDLLQTAAIQTAIDRVAAAGGGEVVVPEGRYRTGGLVLKSGVTLRLEDGAELMGDSNPDNYPGDKRWYRALIRADGAKDIGIVGGRHATINGVNCYDPRGEENYRGPHALMFIGCTNVTLRGYTVRDSANWAHAIFHCGNVRVSGVRVFGGHDALDFHDSTDVTVESCELRTGDDCIAGFANHRCRVRNCVLDSSCQAVRIGGADILFERCRIVHPSSFGHRWGLPPEYKKSGATAGEHCRHGIGSGVIYYCDTRWTINRPQRDIVFRDCIFDRPKRIFALEYDGRNMWCCRHPLESIAFERCTFTEVEQPISIYGDAERPLDFAMRDCTVTAAADAADRELLTAYNFSRITLENVTLKGFSKPHVVTRSKGEFVVKGGTSIANVYRPDPKDRTFTFAECLEALSKEPGDDAAFERWMAERPTPPEKRWSAEKGLYVTDDPLVIDVWGSSLAVFRGETKHAAEISRRLCRGYQYYVGWGRTGAVKPNFDGELSPLAAGPFGYAMAQDDPLFARTFFTDFVRSATKTPAAVSGVRQALKRILR